MSGPDVHIDGGQLTHESLLMSGPDVLIDGGQLSHQSLLMSGPDVFLDGGLPIGRVLAVWAVEGLLPRVGHVMPLEVGFVMESHGAQRAVVQHSWGFREDHCLWQFIKSRHHSFRKRRKASYVGLTWCGGKYRAGMGGYISNISGYPVSRGMRFHLRNEKQKIQHAVYDHFNYNMIANNVENIK